MATSSQTRAQAADAMNPASISNRLNWLRAGVLGANDGIVSTAGLVLGVAGASTSQSALLVAGVAGLVSGALSMAAGEYVSVSTQRDTEKAAIAQEKDELAALPQAELAELATLLEQKGLSHGVAQQAACELTRHNALAAHAEMELGIKPGHYTNPWQAAAASALSFSIGALVPLLAVALAPAGPRLPIAVLAVAMALSVTGLASAKLGNAAMLPALVRNVGGGLLAMGVTFYVGRLVAPLLAA